MIISAGAARRTLADMVVRKQALAASQNFKAKLETKPGPSNHSGFGTAVRLVRAHGITFRAEMANRAFTTSVSTTDRPPPSVPKKERLPLRLGTGHAPSLQTFLVVDKTDLLARILTNVGPAGTDPFLVATAPRRFGKSFAVKQLAAMAKGEKHWFDGYHVRVGYSSAGDNNIFLHACKLTIALHVIIVDRI